MQNRLLFSIIIPIYNCEESMLRRCLDSVRNQSFQEFECILVDDGSTDGSGRICDEYVRILEDCSVIHKKNGGVASARNKGLEVAKGDWILFIDNDDWMEIDALEKIGQRVAKKRFDFAFFDSRKNDKDGNVEVIHSLSFQRWNDDIMTLSPEQKKETLLDYISGGRGKSTVSHGFLEVWSKVYRRDFIKENNLRFDERMTIAEDLVFNLACCMREKDGILYCPYAFYNRYINEKSISHSYHPEIRDNDAIFLSNLQKLAFELEYREEVQKALTKRYVICALGVISYDMRHPDNKKPLSDRTRECKRFVRRMPYGKAIRECSIHWFGKRDRIKILLLRMHLERLYLLF